MSADTQRRDDRPTGLLCELMERPESSFITRSFPKFSWIVPSFPQAGMQRARQIQVASTRELLAADRPDLWDSGRRVSSKSVDVEYAGPPLTPGTSAFWRVRTWLEGADASPYSDIQELRMAPADRTAPAVRDRLDRYPLAQTIVRPHRIVQRSPGHWFVDFGRAAFGYLALENVGQIGGQELEFRFGEKSLGDMVDMKPGGTIRAGASKLRIAAGQQRHIVPMPEFKYPAGAVDLPEHMPTVLPFRYAEILNCPLPVTQDNVAQVTVHYPFDDSAAAFSSSDDTLDAIWELCNYSIKATSFAGVYVDGDRERKPYEADAFINQLCHYYADREFTLARYSHEYLLDHPTWPTEWKHHSIFLAWYDYLYTGNADSLERNYAVLQKKLMLERLRPDGLLGSEPEDVKRNDIVDWPLGERDGFVMTPVNTVVNAFHYRSLVLMEKIASVLGRREDADRYAYMAARVRSVFDATFLNATRGVYNDGIGTDHSSQHANFFPLAFGLLSDANRRSVIEFIKSRGMACSVYAAQYLLDALFENDEADAALKLILDPTTDRSWTHMVRSGTTITWEAWDNRYKPNQDWNHAWGAAPGNLLPRYVLGVRPLEPGFSRTLIQPQLGPLTRVSGQVPTIRGAISVSVEKTKRRLTARLQIPSNMTARIELPAGDIPSPAVTLDGRSVGSTLEQGRLIVDPLPPGTHEITVTAGRRRSGSGAVSGARSAEEEPMRFGDTSRLGRPYAKDPSVVRFGGRYLLYYSLPPFAPERAPKDRANGWSIGIAQSADLLHWHRVGEVLPLPGTVEENGICAPGARVFDGKVHLFYQTYGNGRNDAICHAVSTDGITFERDATNPVFRPEGSWSAGRAIDAEAFEHAGKVYLYYATRDPEMKVQMLGVAAADRQSDYGRSAWTDLSVDGPLLRPELPWERDCIEAATVCRHGDTLYLFYAGGYNNAPQQIGVATSRDAIHWTRLSDRPILPNGRPGEWNSSESGHPGVFVDEDGRAFLFYQGNADHGRTWLISRAALEWREGRPVITGA